MKRTILLCPIAIVLTLNGACGLGPTLSNETAKANSNGPLAANSNQAIETNTTAINANSTISNVVGDQANTGKRSTNSNSSGPMPPLQFQKVDDDSEIATNMTKEGNLQQIRLFKNDRYISKAESVWLDATMKELTLYLRSGKTVKVRTDKLGDLKFASVGALLEFAGVTAGDQPEKPRAADKKTAVQ